MSVTSDSERDEIVLPKELSSLSSAIEAKPESFATGDKDIQDAALAAAKYIFDLTLNSEPRSRVHLQELLQSIEPAAAPQTRAQALTQTGTQKTPTLSHAILTRTPLPELFVTEMKEDQIWAQLELKAANVCETLQQAFDAGDMDSRGGLDIEDEEESSDSEELDDMEGLEGGEEDWEMENSEDGDIEEEEEEEDSDSDPEELGEDVAELRDPSSDEMSGEDDLEIDSNKRPSKKSSSKDRKRHPELDDNFFSLAEFNAEIEEAESKNVTRGSLSKDSDSESDEDDGLDLFAPVSDEEDTEEAMHQDSGEAFYKDFFDPPQNQLPKKRKGKGSPIKPKSSTVRFNDEVRVKHIKGRGKGLPLNGMGLQPKYNLRSDDGDDDFMLGEVNEMDEDDEEDEEEEEGSSDYASGSEQSDQGREAIDRFKNDLFADDDEGDKSKDGLSTHETRMAKLREQIAELEEENVREKDWVLQGEVTSKSRPKNALLEEDLEFENVTKVVPVITDEVVQGLEERIKARILENRFDDVVRKREVDEKPYLPSRMFELQDTKSKESLAQVYENEYMAAQTGKGLDDRDGKLQKECEELEKLWESICYKLDALSNAHFTPKQPKAIISSVSNVSALSLESALPTAKATSTILAPEEVFTPSASDLRSKSEFTPAEKQALRVKERKRRKKQRDTLDKGVDKLAKMNGIKSVKKQKEAALKSVVKNGKGVTVIGKKSQKEKGKKKSHITK